MREKFELACKIVGLLFFCSSIFVLLSGIALFITLTYIPEIPQNGRELLTQSQIAELQDCSNSMRNMYSLIITLFGIIGMLLSLYLMKSNNLFIKLCYPTSKSNPSVDSFDEIKLDTKTEETQKKQKKLQKKSLLRRDIFNEGKSYFIIRTIKKYKLLIFNKIISNTQNFGLSPCFRNKIIIKSCVYETGKYSNNR